MKNQKTSCGSDIIDKSISTIFNNKVFYFCEVECLEEFKIDPVAFIKSDHFLIELEILQEKTS